MRIATIGPKGAGKTMHGRRIAQELGIFHIDFRQRLQEILMRKTKVTDSDLCVALRSQLGAGMHVVVQSRVSKVEFFVHDLG